MERLDNNVRIAVVGTAGVGKSALTVRFLTGRFLQHYDPTLEDEYSTNLMVDGEEREITILDTAGQVSSSYYSELGAQFHYKRIDTGINCFYVL